MSTEFFGDVPGQGIHHTSTVQDQGFMFAVYCSQCKGVIAREVDKARAQRTASYHNTVFIDKPTPTFSWGDWMKKEIAIKD